LIQGKLGKVFEDLFPIALVSVIRADVEIFEIKSGFTQEGGEIMKIESKTYHPLIDFQDERFCTFFFK
jgi:hypothetical protein